MTVAMGLVLTVATGDMAGAAGVGGTPRPNDPSVIGSPPVPQQRAGSSTTVPEGRSDSCNPNTGTMSATPPRDT